MIKITPKCDKSKIKISKILYKEFFKQTVLYSIYYHSLILYNEYIDLYKEQNGELTCHS